MMETFDPYANDGPIEYVVKTGDPSRGASMRDERILLDDGFDASYSSGETSSGSLTALVLAILFMIVAFASM
ncbi:hypothetical protein Q9K01_12070 [Qipengyuania sp. DY56-A-20]|jgi:hypothetical protein|nr:MULTISPECIES: hypothetical protein [Sphingomonadales]MDP4540365.1 hypothetical protein [Qipengyuania sp. DY56-A-20]|tara:strand:+ start:115 stop:330 length:216 start_codon:yes stop_codon:yes gene_type:complete